MENSLLIAVLAGLGGMLGWGLADLFAKKTIDEIGDVVSLVLAHICGSVAMAVFVVYELAQGAVFHIPSDAATWAGLAFFGALQALVYLLVYIGFGKGQVAVLNPIFASFTGIVALVSILFFGEVLSGQLAVSLVVLFLGVLLINTDLAALRERRFSFTRVAGFREVGLATLLAAVWTLGWNSFVGGQDWLTYAAFMYAFMTLALIAYAWMKKVKLSVPKPSLYKYLVLIGVFEVFAYVAISWGYGATSLTSVVALLSGAFSLPTIILARTFLKERTTHLQLMASLLIIIGIVLIAVV